MKKLILGNIMGRGKSALLIEGEFIKQAGFSGEIPDDVKIYDFGDSLILPGFVDIHVHGGDGFDFVDMTKESFDGIRDYHLSKGTTTLCPTLTSCSLSKTFEFLEFYKNFENKDTFAGVHLEGPFLSSEMCGAQNLSYLIAPTAQVTERLLQYSDVISSITVAPELCGMTDFITALKDAGIKISVGHSNADSKTLKCAADLGADRITHMFCATPKRYKEGSFVVGGFEETALTDDRLHTEIIADGHHVCRECLDICLRCKGEDKVIAISDAMRGAGLENADESYLGEIKPENRVIIEDGVAKLPDRSSFAGSVTCGEKMFAVLCRDYRFSVDTAVKLMSYNPAKYLGLDKNGKLSDGYFADIAVVDNDYKVKATFVKGKLR